MYIKSDMKVKLGTDKHGFDYYMGPYNQVYQFKNYKYIGWFCSGPTWCRTMHQVLA
jgi:hypothetical protein